MVFFFFFWVTQWRKIGREELKFLFYKTLLANFSTTTDNSPKPPSPRPQSKNTIATCFYPGLGMFCSSSLGCILTAVDRGARLAGVSPGLPQGAAAGGATDTHSNLCVAGQTPITSRTELQVTVAHTIVCGTTEELKVAPAMERPPQEGIYRTAFRSLHTDVEGSFSLLAQYNLLLLNVSNQP